MPKTPTQQLRELFIAKGGRITGEIYEAHRKVIPGSIGALSAMTRDGEVTVVSGENEITKELLYHPGERI